MAMKTASRTRKAVKHTKRSTKSAARRSTKNVKSKVKHRKPKGPKISGRLLWSGDGSRVPDAVGAV